MEWRKSTTTTRRGIIRTDMKRTMNLIRSSMRNMWEGYVKGDCQLTQAEMERLGNHKYNAEDTSWLDELCMNRFWGYTVTFYPSWLAPNLITLIGLIVNLITVLILSSFCHGAREPAPSWAYLQAALGLFVYQTLDATDGKQARRTGSSSPLGELFDHGCDSMAQVFVTLNICYSMQFGQQRYAVFAISVLSVALFYCAHWSTYCTGQLKFSKFDVTEAQMTVIAVLVVTSILGSNIWSFEIFGVNLKFIVVSCSVFMSLWQMAGYLVVVFSGGIGKNGSTVAGTSVIFPLFPLLAVIVPFCMIYSKSTSGVYDEHTTMFALCFGAVAAKATNRLVIAHMSRSELSLWDWIYLSPIVMMLNQYYDFYINEYYLLFAATIYAYASLIVFSAMICRQFCIYLNICCFSLRPRDNNSAAKGNNNVVKRHSLRTKRS
uniref:diacylglycerol cholinephosphotransferase n=1 Tax=Parascaris univalens TaxID=6257 RepID=A0A915B9X2_PARUN